MTLTHDIRALLAAIDAGDDTALGPLSDALEESGEKLAAGLRRIEAGRDGPDLNTDCPADRCWGWYAEAELMGVHPLDDAVWDRLSRARPVVEGGWVGYPTRSAAFLARGGAATEGESR